MADDSVDLKFLGRQVQVLQGDVRDVRADGLRRDGDVAAIRTDLARMQAETNARFEQIDARLEQLNQTAGLNLEIVLKSIAANKPK